MDLTNRSFLKLLDYTPEEVGGEVQQTFDLFGSVIEKLQKAAVRKIHCIYSSLCAKI